MEKGHTIEKIELEKIVTYEQNTRIHDKKKIELLEKSIKEFRFTNPVLIDENNVLLAGHGRLLAAQKLGLDTIPTIRIDYLGENQKKAYRITDNQLTIKGKWDENLLGIELQSLSELNFDLSLTGFEPTEIDLMIEGLNECVDDSVDDIPDLFNHSPVTQLGDIWQLGEHRIYCANALEAQSYEKLMNNQQARMIFTDPPYNVSITKHAGGLGKIKHQNFIMASGEMNQEEFCQFLSKVFTHLRDYSVDGSLHYFCMDWRHIKEMVAAGDSVYNALKNVCVWNKNNGGMGSMYRSKHEFIFVYKNGKQAHINNVELGKHGRYRTNVWDYDGVNSFSRQDEFSLHPTVKPVLLIADAIKDASLRNDVILDAFLGSGSTLMACEQTARICYGLELKPNYVDVAIIRWQKYTGKEAFNLDTGKAFSGSFGGDNESL